MRQYMGLIVCLLAIWSQSVLLADTYYVKETLEAKPASALADPPESISIVSGRLKDQKAILLKTGSLTWDALKIEGDVFVEWWFKPEGWDALTPAEVKLAGFRIGPTDYAFVVVLDIHILPTITIIPNLIPREHS